jgi:CRISPR type I-E-associated protein CasB/Cse2
MTTNAPDVVTPNVEGQREHANTWGDIATTFAWQMARGNFGRGDLAELRRMNPDRTDSPVLMGLLAQEELYGPPEVERKWALIIHGIALMTPKGGNYGEPRTAHDGQTPVGRALYLGAEATREQGFYSETRLKRLLTSRGGMTRTLLARAFRMLAAAKVTFSWREMSNFIHSDGFNEEAAERHRRRIASEYFQAQYRSQPDTTENE